MEENDGQNQEPSLEGELLASLEGELLELMHALKERDAGRKKARVRRLQSARNYAEQVSIQALGTLLGGALIALFGTLLGIITGMSAFQLGALGGVVAGAVAVIGLLLGTRSYPEERVLEGLFDLYVAAVEERKSRERKRS